MNLVNQIRTGGNTIPASTLRVLAYIGVVVISIFLPSASDTIFPYHYEEGKVWSYETLVAEWDFPVYKSEEKLEKERESALQSYVPCFRWVGNQRSAVPILTAKDMRIVEQGNYDHIAVINTNHRTQNIPFSKLYTPKTAYEQTKREMSPTLMFDSVTSAQVRESIIESVTVTEGAVMKDEIIVEHGEMVTSDVYRILSSLERVYADRGLSEQHIAWAYLSRGLLSLLLVGLFVLYLFSFRRWLWEQTRASLFFCMLMGIMEGLSILILHFTNTSLIYIIPFAWIPILVRIFYDSRTAFFLHLTTVMLVSLSVPNPYLFLLLQIPIGMVSVGSLKDLMKRSQLAYTALYIFIAYSVIYVLYNLMVSGDMSFSNWKIYLYFALNSLLVITLYSLVYLFEKMFRLVSSLTLVELSNINSDMMQTFAQQAPGTFQHSLQVSNLSSEAAKSIGADALLVRTAALYHDIGKLSHPTWFVENQTDRENPLLQMTNRDAARAVIAHVKEGEKIAEQHHLPEIVKMFIRTHHGTSLVRYFYNSEKNRLLAEGSSTTSLNDNDYRYPGPKPQTKESAILMMADAVEARSHSMDVYTEQSLSDMVEQMITLQFEDGQLAETPLTFSDLARVKSVFKERLMSMYHHRIQYPEVKQ